MPMLYVDAKEWNRQCLKLNTSQDALKRETILE